MDLNLSDHFRQATHELQTNFRSHIIGAGPSPVQAAGKRRRELECRSLDRLIQTSSLHPPIKPMIVRMRKALELIEEELHSSTALSFDKPIVLCAAIPL